MVEAATEYLLKQGLGYVLFLFTLGGLIWAIKGWLEEKDKRANDLKEYGKLYTETSKDLLNGIDNVQKSVDALVTIHNNGKQ